MDRERAARPWPGDGSRRGPLRPQDALQAARDGVDESAWSWVGEDTEQARAHGEKLDRLAADVDLHTRLALLRFTGPEYAQFQTELTRYGYDVMTGWLRTGKIFVKMREIGIPLPSAPDGALDHDAQDELAGETVTVALWNFHHQVLLRGRWDPQRGARLTTFFVGQCKLRFANIYRAWLRRETRHGDLVDPTEAGSPIELSSSAESPELVAMARSHVRRGTRTVEDPRMHRALEMIARDRPRAEIAAEVGMTGKALDRMLANHRDRLQQRGIE